MNKKADQIGKVLHIKNNKRKIQRRMEIENYELQTALDSLEWEFYQELFLKETDCFDSFNNKWLVFCSRWNQKHTKHVQQANSLAFHEKNINSNLNNNYDKPIKFDNPKLFSMFGIL